MIESYLLILLGPVGLAFFIFGLWLFRKGKKIEKKMFTDKTKKLEVMFANYSLDGAGFGLWGQHSTKPLAYICIVTGIICLFVSSVSVFNFSFI